ncbi:hypothetical protein PHMEG_00028132 [Phytophthora megakarya]|uniref:Uncharacterized protein n=1 Tax=Phytophthora megakarya TaxID=4795 RepID=A0A225V686_9STRA|nr:hypothetical protein PHMEG_00028132 [Phytophthora megakarya]
MDRYDCVKVRREVYEIRENTVNPRSRTTYLNSYSRYISWVALSKQPYVSAAFIEEIDGVEGNTKQQLRARVKENRSLTNHFKGLKNKLVKNVGNGIDDVKTGKDPLVCDLYTFLCEKMLSHSAKKMTFSHTYMVIAWNLMCRSPNAFRIRHSHMEWRGNALQIYCAHMKDDQGGDRPRDPRHYERFRKSLRRILAQDNVVVELSRQGLKATELGTYSMWNDAATFCTFGSTGCPSSTAVHLRTGRSLGGVQNTYLRYEAAGDMHVGRTIAGLPTESSQFSL